MNRSNAFSQSRRLVVLALILILSVTTGSSRSHASSPVPYQPPLDYSQESLDTLIGKLDSPKEEERASAIYYLGDRLGREEHAGDLRRTFQVLKDSFAKEEDAGVTDVLRSTLSNMFRGKPDSQPAKLFHEEEGFWLRILAGSDNPSTLQMVLFLVNYHKAGWADASVVAALSFPNDSVRMEACKTVASLRLMAAQPVLRRLLRDPDKTGAVHTSCANALAYVGTKVAIPDLEKARNDRKAKGRSVEDFDHAIMLILSSLQAVPELIRGATERPWPGKNYPELPALPNEVVKGVTGEIESDPKVKQAYAKLNAAKQINTSWFEGVKELEKLKAVWSLQSCLCHPHDDVQIHALRALACLKDERSLPFLLKYASAMAVHESGSENATIHGVIHDETAKALSSITGLQFKMKGGQDPEGLKAAVARSTTWYLTGQFRSDWKNGQRAKVAKNLVAALKVGMTTQEVASILERPSRLNDGITKDGDSEKWTFTITLGRILVLTFEENKLSSIDGG